MLLSNIFKNKMFKILLVLLLIALLLKVAASNFKYDVSKVSNRQLLCSLLNALEAGAEQVLNSKTFTKDSKEPSDGFAQPVTSADLDSNNHILSSLPFDNKIKIITEEEQVKEVEPNSEPTFCPFIDIPEEFYSYQSLQIWIDPLDATQEFTEGGDLLKCVSVMGCVVHGGEPIIGILINPFEVPERRLYWGYTTLDGKRSSNIVFVPGRTPRSVMMSRSHSNESETKVIEAFRHVALNVNVIKTGGSGFKTLSVLRGDADFYIHKTTIKKWDLCAPNAIVRATGAKMVDFDMNKVNYNDFDNPQHKSGVIVSHYVSKIKELGKVLSKL